MLGRSAFGWTLPLLLAVVATACGDNGAGSTGGNGGAGAASEGGAATGGAVTGGAVGGAAGSPTAGGAGAGNAAGSAGVLPECHDLAALGPIVTPRGVAEPPPTPVGGSLPPGTYELVDIVYYDGRVPSANLDRITIRLTAAAAPNQRVAEYVEWIQFADGTTDQRDMVAVWTVSGNQITSGPVCGDFPDISFSIVTLGDATELHIFTSADVVGVLELR